MPFLSIYIEGVNCFSSLETSSESLSMTVLLLFSKFQLFKESFSGIVQMCMCLCMHTCKAMEIESTVSYKRVWDNHQQENMNKVRVFASYVLMNQQSL